MNQNTRIYELINEPLSAVSFVQDYVEFHFDGRIVRSLTNPLLIEQKTTYRFPDTGSRDILCSLIGQTVDSISVSNHESITLHFLGGKNLIIPLAAPTKEHPEAAHYVPGSDQPIEVW